MPSGFSSPSGTFNGGTITNPLVINTGDPNTIPLQIRASSPAQNVDFFSIFDTAFSQHMLEFDPAGVLDVNNGPTTNARLPGSAPIYTGSGVRSQVVPSGALSTLTPSTGVGVQNPTGRDVVLFIPLTLNPSGAAAATCLVELSPDNVTYTTLGTITLPVGVVFDGTIVPLTLPLPYGFYVRLTVTNATIGTGHYW